MIDIRIFFLIKEKGCLGNKFPVVTCENIFNFDT